MITKEVQLNRIQIVDEREPWAAQHGQVVVRWSLLLIKDGLPVLYVAQMEDMETRIYPESDLGPDYDWGDAAFATLGFGPGPVGVRSRVQALCTAERTPLMLARWKVNNAIRTQAGLAVAKEELAALEGPSDLSLHQETRFNLAEVLADGQVQIRLRKCICESGVVISPPQYHRFVLAPGGNHVATMTTINTAMARHEGTPALPQGDIDRIARICATDHTPQRIAAFQAAEAARRARGR